MSYFLWEQLINHTFEGRIRDFGPKIRIPGPKKCEKERLFSWDKNRVFWGGSEKRGQNTPFFGHFLIEVSRWPMVVKSHERQAAKVTLFKLSDERLFSWEVFGPKTGFFFPRPPLGKSGFGPEIGFSEFQWILLPCSERGPFPRKTVINACITHENSSISMQNECIYP